MSFDVQWVGEKPVVLVSVQHLPSVSCVLKYCSCVAMYWAFQVNLGYHIHKKPMIAHVYNTATTVDLENFVVKNVM